MSIAPQQNIRPTNIFVCLHNERRLGLIAVTVGSVLASSRSPLITIFWKPGLETATEFIGYRVSLWLDISAGLDNSEDVELFNSLDATVGNPISS